MGSRGIDVDHGLPDELMAIHFGPFTRFWSKWLADEHWWTIVSVWFLLYPSSIISDGRKSDHNFGRSHWELRSAVEDLEKLFDFGLRDGHEGLSFEAFERLLIRFVQVGWRCRCAIVKTLITDHWKMVTAPLEWISMPITRNPCWDDHTTTMFWPWQPWHRRRRCVVLSGGAANGDDATTYPAWGGHRRSVLNFVSFLYFVIWRHMEVSNLWGYPQIPSHHPFADGIFHYNPSGSTPIYGTPHIFSKKHEQIQLISNEQVYNLYSWLGTALRGAWWF
jgi:hypothetical protein